VGATIACAVGLWAADLGWNVFDSSALDLGLTIVWVLGLVNAFNLMDNLDGATGSVAAASAVGIGAFALVNDGVALAALSFGLVGACLGFRDPTWHSLRVSSSATGAACRSASSSPRWRSPPRGWGTWALVRCWSARCLPAS